MKGDKNLSEQSAVQQSILSPLPSRAKTGRMDGKQASHLGKLERSNKRPIAQPLPEETKEKCLHPFVVVGLQCFLVRLLEQFIFNFIEASSTIKMDLMTENKSYFSEKYLAFIGQL